MNHLSRITVLLLGFTSSLWLTGSAFASCASPQNAIETENCLAGTPQSQWDVSGAGDTTIQGFATDISFNRGQTVSFKVNTNATNYKLDIYRMGYYGGNGARLVATISPTAKLPQIQPNCVSNSTGLLDCGTWAVSASWAIPATATSGIYFVKLTRTDTGGASHIAFIVRNDASTSDILFKTSDTAWQAYNDYGGGNFYTGGPGPQGGDYKISYNRPFHTRVYEFYSWIFNAEYPMVRFLEANGYDVSYFTSLDADRSGSLILQHKVFLSVGHDEYWSGNERANVETARAAGVNLGFFSSNEIFWKTRWEPSIDGSNTANRTLVCYKETHSNAVTDPLDPPTWTGTWRDARFSPPADGGRPENGLSGTIFMVNGPTSPAMEMQVPSADGKMRFWRNTGIASQAATQTYTTNSSLLGYEWDIDADNGFRPAGLFDLATATYSISGNYLLDNGSTYGNGTATHHATIYRFVNAGHSALVFGAGTSQWPWALDANHDGGVTTPDKNLQQATVNLFADMGAQPVTLQAGLLSATTSTDSIPPTSAITAPSAGSTVQPGALITISGSATDTGGGVVGGVEVSTDGGTTWHPATGRGSWSYGWTVPAAGGSATIRSRAVDDSGNLETTPPSVTVTIAGGTSPSVTSVTPVNGATGVSISTVVAATFSQAMNASTITGSTFSLVDSTNKVVPATVSYNSANLQASLIPTAALTNSTTYTATVVGGSAGVKSTTGNAIPSSFVWTFTTAATSSGNCPCSLWSAATVPANPSVNDPNQVELGVRFTSDLGGFISGIRFYKGTANTGTHLGNLWSSTGALLASATFTGETASGWQQVLFANPVAIQANTVYVASYHTNIGMYAADNAYFATSAFNNAPLHALQDLAASGGNAVYVYGATAFPSRTFQSSNYWVDVVFTNTATPAPPVVTTVSPLANATTVPITSAVTAQFNTAMTASSINTSTIQLLDPTSTLLPATVSYNATNLTATLTPSSPLNSNTTYTAVVKGGSTQGTSSVLSQSGTPMTSNFSWTFTTSQSSSSYLGGPGGPILVVTSTADTYSTYLAEILRNEGLNEFAVLDVSQVTATTLSSYTTVVLGHTPLTSAQVAMFTTWVNAGGDLIAMRPDKQLATLLGLTDAGSTRSDAYLLVNTGSGPGAGIVAQTMQYHNIADLYTLSGATTVATLYSNATTATSNPAVTVRSVGSNGGQVAAFTYDLAKSVVYTRQGNPAWSGQARDGQTGPIRSDDLYFGAATFDPQPDWVDLNKVAIPQADEQQRLLANLILSMQSTKPLPRFWYFPSGSKAVVVMTGDDHGSFYSGSATSNRFNDLIAAGPAGCSVADWQCVRATAYLFPQNIASNPLTDAQAASYVAQGFEIGVHVDSTPTCSNWTTTTALDSFYSTELASFASQFPSVPAPQTHRMHCIGWSDYDSQPQIELKHGIRLDTTYYYWPPTWINNVPGMFTGSGLPMRYADRNGNMLDVYQAATQMTDESGQTYPLNINTLLNNAAGSPGYYGAFVANMHNDQGPDYPGPGANQIVTAAQALGVPVVSATQMLTWIDGRNASSFASITWTGNVLSFTVNQAAGARNLQAMLPVNFAASLNTLTRGGVPVSFTTQTIKGISYALFGAVAGNYQATYSSLSSLSSISLAPSTVSGGSTSTGTVTLGAAAPSGGAVVTLSSSNTAVAQVGASVTVPAGATTATFPVTTSTITTSTPITITGTYGTTKSATLTVTGTSTTSITSLTLNPITVTGGSGSTGTVTLSGPAPSGGTAVTVSSNVGAATVSSPVTVAAGSTSAVFAINTTSVTTSTSATITASYNSSSSSATLTITPATVTAAITIDTTVSTDRTGAGTSIATPAFSTTATNELLLAFVSSDGNASNMTVTGVSGGGLTWTLVVRANAQLGTAEIWRAFAPSTLTNVSVTATLAQRVSASITVETFKGVNTTGTGGSGAIGATKSASAASGAPSSSLATTRNGSLVIGVGNDWDNAVARTIGPNQTMVHQYLATVGDTYWIQRQNASTPTAGTTVLINDSAPTADRFNLSICEILSQ